MPSRKKIVLVDLDRTLIDTDLIHAQTLAIADRSGVSREWASATYKKISKAGFDRRRYIETLVTDPARRAIALKEVEELYAVERRFNFSGIEHFLARLGKKYRLVLFSHGHRPHQLAKLDQARLRKFFKEIVITKTAGKEKEIPQFYKKYGDDILLIDDADIVAENARRVGMKLVRIKRGKKDKNYFKKIFKKVLKMHG